MNKRPRFSQRTEHVVKFIPGGPQPDPAHEWERTDLADKDRWYAVFSQLFRGAGVMTYLERAQRLAFYGWRPGDLEFICSHPKNLAVLEDADTAAEDLAESLAALTQEAVTYYTAGLDSAMQRRAMYMARLHQVGWSFAQIGRLVGISKQRAHRVVESVPPPKDA